MPIAAPSPAEHSPALVEAELERIAASTPFRRATRHLRFLRHLVLHTLSGDASRLREMALGVDVFYRSATRFDPRGDSIVRVEARRLRQRLASYYADEGHDARLRFELPVGSYLVDIRHRAEPTPGARPRIAIAVHHLVNATADAALDGSIRGLSIEFISALSRLSGIRIVADDAVPALGPALQQRARLLRVSSVLVGTVTGGPNLELRLIDAADGSVVWTQRSAIALDRALDALEPLARSVIHQMQRSAEEQQLQRVRLAGNAPLVRGAFTAVVREQMALARAALARGTLEGCDKAVQLAQSAVLAAPEHAPAHALLSDALISGVAITAWPAHPTMAAARDAAQRAITLEPELADAHSDLGTIAFTYDRDWSASETQLLRALRFGPGEARSHARYGWTLMVSGRFGEARACYAEARELDPLSMKYRVHEGLIELYARRFERAAQAFDAVLDIAPDHLVASSLAAALKLYAGQVDAGLTAFRALAQRFPKVSVGRCGVAQALAMCGDEAAARRELASIRTPADDSYLSPYQLAMVHTRLGETDAALSCLADAAALRDFNFVCAGVDPAFDVLRRDARFAALLTAHGMAAVATR